MNSLWGTVAYSPHSHCYFLQASNTLLVPVCLFANVSHTAWLEVEKSKKTKHSDTMQPSSLAPIFDLSSNLKGSRRQDTIIATGSTSSNLLFRLRFSSSARCVLWMLATLIFFFHCCCSPVNAAARWWCVCRAALSDYRVEQHCRLSYHSELSQSAVPTGTTLHQRTKEKIKECNNSITIWSQSLTGDKTQCDTCNASNYRKNTGGGSKQTQHNILRSESQKKK